MDAAISARVSVIGGPETAALMRDYLADGDFGHPLLWSWPTQWTAANEPSDGERLCGRPDFSRGRKKRASARRDPAVTSAEAEAIFSAIEPLIAEKRRRMRKNTRSLSLSSPPLCRMANATIRFKAISLASPPLSARPCFKTLSYPVRSSTWSWSRTASRRCSRRLRRRAGFCRDGDELSGMASAAPFTNRPAEAFDVVRGLPEINARRTAGRTIGFRVGTRRRGRECPVSARGGRSAPLRAAATGVKLHSAEAPCQPRDALWIWRRRAFEGKGVDGWHMALSSRV